MVVVLDGDGDADLVARTASDAVLVDPSFVLVIFPCDFEGSLVEESRVAGEWVTEAVSVWLR